MSEEFVEGEFETLKEKLKERSPENYEEIKDIRNPDLVPLFETKEG